MTLPSNTPGSARAKASKGNCDSSHVIHPLNPAMFLTAATVQAS